MGQDKELFGPDDKRLMLRSKAEVPKPESTVRTVGAVLLTAVQVRNTAGFSSRTGQHAAPSSASASGPGPRANMFRSVTVVKYTDRIIPESC